MAQWRQVSMREAVIFIRDEAGQPLDEPPAWSRKAGLPDSNRGSPGVEYFDNGVAVACASDWTGPYSEVTPEVDADPPQWFIYC